MQQERGIAASFNFVEGLGMYEDARMGVGCLEKIPDDLFDNAFKRNVVKYTSMC